MFLKEVVDFINGLECMVEFAPITVFAYKRKEKVEGLFESLKDCYGAKESEVIIFCDGAKNENDFDEVLAVRDYIETIPSKGWFKRVEINKLPYNKGLAKSIIDGVTDVINRYGSIIVLEDDLVVSKDFIRYMNGALSFYKDDKRYGEISSYSLPIKALKKYKKDVYVLRIADCWGWATWKDRWDGCDWSLSSLDDFKNNARKVRDLAKLNEGMLNMLENQKSGKYDTWAARWFFHLYNMNQWTVYPKECRTVNVGYDGSGTNCDKNNQFDNELYTGKDCVFEFLPYNTMLEKKNHDYSIIRVPLYRVIFNAIWMRLHNIKLFLKKEKGDNGD